nr:hypothetical protein [Tanacetum cinerariifolium]
MAETMVQYMGKTRADYGLRITRPKIDDRDSFELKGQFLKELCDNTFNGLDHEDANKHIEKVLEIVDLFHIANITQDQVTLRAFPVSLTGADVILFYNGLEVPTQKILNSKGAIPSKTAADAKVAIQEMVEYSQKWHNRTSRTKSTKTFDGQTAIQLNLTFLYGNHEGASVSVMPRSTYIKLGLGKLSHTKLTIELADRIVKYPKGIAKNVLVAIGLRERIELDLEARLMGKTLVLNRSLDSLCEDYIELNDLNIPLELRRHQVDDLMPTIEDGDVIDEPMINIFKTRNNESFDEYPSFCDFDWKIHIDCAYNLRFSYMIVVENMDGYRHQDMGDIILEEPFCKASCVKARWFASLITIHNVNDSKTYQMARSHPRFKHISNSQCNKIKPLLKDPNKYEMQRWKNGSHTV